MIDARLEAGVRLGRTMPTRRAFLRHAGVLTATGIIGNHVLSAAAAGQRSVTLPFENGARELVAFPQKRPLIVLTARPPQLETPFAVFNEGLLTPNDAFFVRYHWSGLPHVDRSRGLPAEASAATSTLPWSCRSTPCAALAIPSISSP